MSGCPGVHCPGCGKGGITAGGLLVAAGAVALLLARKRIIAAGHAVEHGTDVLLHTTWEVIEWAAAVLAVAVGLAVTIALLYGVTVLARKYLERRTTTPVPPAIVTCTILPAERADTVPARSEPEPEQLAIERGPGLLLALFAALGHEGAPVISDDEVKRM